MRVKVGDAFDIVAERKQTDYKVIVSGHLYEYAYEIKIRNHKDGPVTVVVNEPNGGTGKWFRRPSKPARQPLSQRSSTCRRQRTEKRRCHTRCACVTRQATARAISYGASLCGLAPYFC
jgi:hypothetical protein